MIPAPQAFAHKAVQDSKHRYLDLELVDKFINVHTYVFHITDCIPQNKKECSCAMDAICYMMGWFWDRYSKGIQPLSITDEIISSIEYKENKLAELLEKQLDGEQS